MHRRARKTGFTLTEMLVVIGIVTVIVGLILPAVMHARRQGKLTTCMNNLRQIGSMYLLYAEKNDDYIPLGTSRFKDQKHEFKEEYTTGPWVGTNGYLTRNNQFLWVEGAPSSAMGPFLLGRIITPDNARILYCPAELIPCFRLEYNIAGYRRALAGDPVNIRIGYAVRPVHRFWTHDHVTHTVEYPPLMPKLIRNDRLALVAEHPQRRPVPHGTDGHRSFNVLYGDSSVRTLSMSLLKPAELYYTIDFPFRDGELPGSNGWALNPEIPERPTIWKLLDEN
jgi:prepilin-type N-terminal cleavage/methylation domain-containing protein